MTTGFEDLEEVEAPFEHKVVKTRTTEKAEDLYEMLELLGQGKFGSVHRCKEKSSQKILAAKFIKTNSKAERDEVENEIFVMKQLQHPRLLQLYDSFDMGKEMIMILEMLSGGELFERVIDDEFELTERECIFFMIQICEGVKFMHEQNILHLDLKPENILCLAQKSNKIKIIDFGLARSYDPKLQIKVLFGTPEFVAPEVINYEQIGKATDMWSVGVICYVLLSGLSPFMGDSDAETLTNVTMAQWDFEDECFDEISDEAKNFIEQLLVKDQSERCPAQKCLEHSWLVETKNRFSEHKLSKDKLKKYVMRRKWKKAINGVLALVKMGVKPK